MVDRSDGFCPQGLRSGMARGGRRRRWRWLRRVALCLAVGALVAAALNLPAEHRDYVAARLLLDALPNPPFHLPATAAGRPVTRTIQLGQGTAATTTASLWLPTRGSRLPGIVVAVGAAPLGRRLPVGAGYSVTSCDLRILTDQSTEPISPYDPPSRQDSS